MNTTTQWERTLARTGLSVVALTDLAFWAVAGWMVWEVYSRVVV